MNGYTVTDLLTDLASVIHGTTINKVPNVYGMINRAARQLLLDVDPKETQRIVQMAQIFDDVFDYALPPDVKGDRIIDLALQGDRTPWETFIQTYAETFDANKFVSFANKIYTQWNTGLKTIRIEAPFLTSPIQLANTGSITGWTVGGGATNLSLDQTNNVAGGGAIVVNLSAGQTTGFLQTSSLNPTNLSNYVNNSTGFLWVYMPSGSAITNINVQWGTNSTNYYFANVTTTQPGTTFQNGWNLLAIPWLAANLVGSPNPLDYQYVKVTPTYNGTLQTNFKICNLTFALGYYFEIKYYSKYLFRDPLTNAFQEKVIDATDNGKLINLDTESYNLLFNKVAFFVAQSLQGADAEYDAEYFDSEYNAALTRYKAQNPSEAIKKTESYYRLPNKGYTRFSPGIYNNGC